MSEKRAAATQTRPRVVVGVTAGIAAYKTAILVRLLIKKNLDVTVIPTSASLEMVGKTTWEALTGKPVYTQTPEDAPHVTHVRLGTEADLVVVAPATANTLAKMRAGMADNLLTNTLLVAECPILMVPAMHTQMWENPATVENVQILRARGVEVMEPAAGRLTGKDSGKGRMPEPEEIAARAFAILGITDNAAHGEERGEENVEETARAETSAEEASANGGSFAAALRGRQIVISAGGTREAIDPVRFIGNRSSGRFGVEIARAAQAAGAHVTLVAANIDGQILNTLEHTDIELVRVESAQELQTAMLETAASADVIVMSAAVADYRPANRTATKQKKDGTGRKTIELVENPDILAELTHTRRREGQIIIGFAAETGDAEASVLEYGRAKAARKGADLMVINEVGTERGFGEVETAITIIDRAGTIMAEGQGSKTQMAHKIIDTIAGLSNTR
ncbi:phosphopantothenoylcysteine decarboxylase [Actinobaculum suis]|uniref:Coenzyme A biosynthesis bifunctional protein CoaBC n=1 Tax=Actinobaculum suis TaxID=1657 RepID=A0A7Z9C8G8_9ACTO|nr:bifunctional phosphopantothenoylcysteine decarboxylase/phosphopantothenate synthase [Actinobaculum suis]VDG76439.1 phosphopantothenoylcysteine decarboxylase [Actinobaculum suis]